MKTLLAEFHFALRAIVKSVTADENLYDDLFQEACLHLWKQQTDRPGQATSWYLQSCRFRLLKVLAAGLSLDSLRRSPRKSAIEDLSEQAQLENLPSTDPVIEAVSAKDAERRLLECITPAQREILKLLAQGFQVSEVAALIGISHQAVSNHREAIASTARELGLRS